MRKTLTILAGILFLTNLKANAQAGSLDLSFSTDGIAVFGPGSLQDVVYAISLQNDQKIVFTGVARITSTTGFTSDLVVGRLNTDGSLDSSFGTNGIYNLAAANGSVFGYDVKIQPDGKIVVCGGYSVTASNTDFITLRLNTDGTPDTTFGGGDGISIIPVGSSEDYAYELEILAGGEIILAGTSSVPGFTYERGIVMRLLADGSLDNTFGASGYTSLQLSPNSAETFRCMEVLPSGKIVAAGYSYVNNTEYLLMAAFTPDGNIDSTFALNGVFTGSSISQAFDMASDGNLIYLSGRITTSGGYDMGICCFDTSGSPNVSFGQGGTVVANYNPIDAGLGIALQPDGKIICVGTSGLGTFGNRDMLVTRYLPTGVIDPAFAGTGYVIIPVSSNFEEANSVALQADGKIVLGGFASFSNNEMVFIRLNNDLAAGISTDAAANAFTVFPVPLTGNTLMISASILPAEKSMTCELIDMTGRLLVSRVLTAEEHLMEFNIPSETPAGTYLIRLVSDGRVYSRTVVKN